jgi:translation initiation factor 2B subunit (eIF-2B alpha/beta/delta family)
MAFGLQKLAVLESKLSIYEDLSKEMLDKLERAVDKISEGNNQIAQVLARHEEKLENSIRADELLLHMMEAMKESNSKEHQAVIKRIETVETRVNDLATFRWITVGIATTAAVIISSAGFFGNLLTTGNNGSTLGGANQSLSR